MKLFFRIALAVSACAVLSAQSDRGIITGTVADATGANEDDAEPTPAQIEARRNVYEILSRRYDSGHHDTAERHNEHQP